MIKSSKKNLTTKNKSVILALKAKNLIDDSLLVCINSLTLEDLIAIKLELSANHINNRPYGFDIWRKSGYIGLRSANDHHRVDLKDGTKPMTIFIPGPFGLRKGSRSEYGIDFTRKK